METLHATCIAVDGKGVLLCGPSGSGKSDLALRLIDEGAKLIADDLVAVEASPGQQLLGNFPEGVERQNLKGMIEARGLGLVKVPHRDWVRIDLLVELGETPERLPERKTKLFCGVEIETLALSAFEASTPAKIRLALQRQTMSD